MTEPTVPPKDHGLRNVAVLLVGIAVIAFGAIYFNQRASNLHQQECNAHAAEIQFSRDHSLDDPLASTCP